MKLNAIKEILIDTINEYFEGQDIEEKSSETTILFGKDAVLDSMGLVNVIIDIESRFLDDDIAISLTSEKAMSRRNSPFRTIITLAEFIHEQIENDDE
jgi:acyl carrier protein